MISRCINEGPRALKEFAHKTRVQALLRQSNPKAARKWFLASTVTRSIDWPVLKTDIDTKVQEAMDRWMCERKVDLSLLDRISFYIRNILPLNPLPVKYEAEPPIANNHACITHSRKEGGTAARLKEIAIKSQQDQIDMLSPMVNMTTYAQAAGASPPVDSLEYIVKVCQDEIRNIRTGRGCLPGSVDLRQRYGDMTDPPLRPLPIREMGGKIRIVTLHPAEEIQVARHMTANWLGQLRKCVTTRSMLRNEQVRLEPQDRHSKVYSADLSSATDYIDHGLAQHVARLLCERMKRPWDMTAAKQLFSPKMLPDGRLTRSGIHMGLGPTWVILSILNGFAAWEAGARRDTYRICGDDLTALWPKAIKVKYESVLERLGLVVNKSKSFFGKRGVFCERIVEARRGQTVATDVGHLSALTAAKLRAGRSDAALATADALESHLGLGHIVRRVRQTLVHATGPGKVRHLGRGEGSPHIAAIESLLTLKPQLCKATPVPKEVMDDIKANQSDDGEISVDDFLIEFYAARQCRDFIENTTVATHNMTPKQHRNLSRVNRPGREKDPDYLASLINASSLSRSNKRLALRLNAGHFGKRTTPSVRARLINVVTRRPARKFLDHELCKSIIRRTFHLDWDSRLEKRRRDTKSSRAPPIHPGSPTDYREAPPSR